MKYINVNELFRNKKVNVIIKNTISRINSSGLGKKLDLSKNFISELSIILLINSPKISKNKLYKASKKITRNALRIALDFEVVFKSVLEIKSLSE